MRQSGPGGRRPRGRHHNGGSDRQNSGNTSAPMNQMGGNRPRSAASLHHKTFDSNGPDVRVRGNAWQVYEKYQSLARDATSAGDRVLAENYQQYAEHYYRIIEAINEATAGEQRTRAPQQQPSYAGQPEVPSNYYAPDGSLMGSPQPASAPQPDPLQPMSVSDEAEVRSLTPPPSLFTPEEIEEHAGAPDKLLAQR